jgi:hypothetical protein
MHLMIWIMVKRLWRKLIQDLRFVYKISWIFLKYLILLEWSKAFWNVNRWFGKSNCCCFKRGRKGLNCYIWIRGLDLFLLFIYREGYDAPSALIEENGNEYNWLNIYIQILGIILFFIYFLYKIMSIFFIIKE